MLVTLIRRYSKPYLPYIAAVVIFQLASTVAALCLSQFAGEDSEASLVEEPTAVHS